MEGAQKEHICYYKFYPPFPHEAPSGIKSVTSITKTGPVLLKSIAGTHDINNRYCLFQFRKYGWQV